MNCGDDDDAKEHRERKVMVAAGHWHGIGISIAPPMHERPDAKGREMNKESPILSPRQGADTDTQGTGRDGMRTMAERGVAARAYE